MTRPPILETSSEPDAPITILGVIADEVTTPRNDGTRGSGLYAIPFRLSRRPSSEWAEIFVQTWNHPPRYTSMHRRGIARIQGAKLILDGTTIDEVEKYHRETLKHVIERTNELALEQERARKQREDMERQRILDHEAKVREAAERLKFD